MNLIEGIQKKCNYIRDAIIPEYDAIGEAGRLGKIMLLQDIKKGEAAIAGGDVIEMLRVYKELESTCERAL
ncbi:MAG: hypothetical protein WA213_21005 [Terriglobales bacterium]